MPAKNQKINKKLLAKFYTPDAIIYEIGSADLISDEYIHTIAEAISLLPHRVIDFVFENVVIIAGGSKDFGHYWGASDLRFNGKPGFIVLENCLFEEKPIEILFTIAHEIAHAWNKDAIDNIKKTEKNEGIKREIKADKQAIKWLSKHFKIKDLKKCCKYLGNKNFTKLKNNSRSQPKII